MNKNITLIILVFSQIWASTSKDFQREKVERASAEKFPGRATEKRSKKQKRPKNSTIKPLSTVSCIKIKRGPRPPLPRC